MHNLGHPDIAIDVNEHHINFEPDVENLSRRKRHQDGNDSCDHDVDVQCRFGAVHYADPSRPDTGFPIPKGRPEWLRNRLDWLKTEKAKLQSSESGKF